MRVLTPTGGGPGPAYAEENSCTSTTASSRASPGTIAAAGRSARTGCLTARAAEAALGATTRTAACAPGGGAVRAIQPTGEKNTSQTCTPAACSARASARTASHSSRKALATASAFSTVSTELTGFWKRFSLL